MGCVLITTGEGEKDLIEGDRYQSIAVCELLTQLENMLGRGEKYIYIFHTLKEKEKKEVSI